MASALRKPDWEDEPDDWSGTGDGQMPFLDHLDELRRRLIYCAIAIGIGLGLAFAFVTPIFDFIMGPIAAGLPPGSNLISTNPAGGFSVYLRMAAIAGTVLAMPVVMLQVWLFVAPALYRDEKRLAIPFVLLSSVLFALGALFSHYVVFPMSIRFFTSFSSAILKPQLDIEQTFDIYERMVLSFGVVFQLPVVALFLARIGILTARFLVRQAKYAVLVIFIAAAALTPGGDPYVQCLMALPMLGLYALGIGLVWMFEKGPAVE